MRTCCGSRRRTARCCTVAARSGTSGGFGGGGPTGVRDVPPPAGLAGPTHLDLTVDDPPYGNGPERRFEFVLDCDGGPTSSIADVPAACAHLVGDRYTLLAPVQSDAACSGIMGTPSLTLAGTFLGVTVRRDFSSCSLVATFRWLEELRIPPSEPYVAYGDAYSAGRVPIVGGSPAERRAARTALRGVGEGVVDRIRFARRDRRRVVEATPRPPAADAALPAHDAAWVADVVRREIGRRLHGQDAATFQRGRIRGLVFLARRHAAEPRAARRLVRPAACRAGTSAPAAPSSSPSA